ncbi:hypothetical protein BDC45DRAFT_573281 [Circinella umbellata]|nr:hypothetical protein BDC45DRAFT_573281 [Circinella umbellata]
MYQNDCTSTTSFKSHNNSDNYEYYVYDESAGNENKDDDDEDDIDEEQSFNADKGRNCEDIDEEQEFKDFSKEKSIVSRCVLSPVNLATNMSPKQQKTYSYFTNWVYVHQYGTGLMQSQKAYPSYFCSVKFWNTVSNSTLKKLIFKDHRMFKYFRVNP